MDKGRAKERVPDSKETETSLSSTFTNEDLLPNDLQLSEGVLPSKQGDNDDNILSSAKTYWLFGEWVKLAELDVSDLQNHPDRDRIVLLIASAHLQLGDHAKAQKLVLRSLDWGCPKRVVAQILVDGVHNTLGRIAALKEDEPRIAFHFDASVAAVGKGDRALVSHARSVREMARMGLLPQAAMCVDQQLQVDNEKGRPNQQEAHYKILRSEIQLLSHELSLAQQRHQIFSAPVTDDHVIAIQKDNPKDPVWLASVKKSSLSQLGQDLWVLEQLGYKRDGFFVEFGATDGVLLSNSWLLEKSFDWRGICAEPNPKFMNALKKNRGCTISNACIGAKTGESVEFIFADAYGGMQKHLNDDNHADKRTAYLNSGEVKTLETISLHDFLTQCEAPHDIDYMSIDTEGSEYEILESFPFDRWNIRLMTIEHNFTHRRADIRSLMERNGYHCTEMQFDDWYSKAF